MTRQNIVSAWVCGAAIALGVGTVASAQTVIYDSGGFEPPRFVVGGSLEGQDAPPAGQGPWQRDVGSTGTAVVTTTNPNGGLQAVQVTRPASTTGDSRWAVIKPVVPTPSQSAVRIQTDVRVNQATFGGTPPNNTDFGPAFGIEAYDGSGGGSGRLIGSLTIDATTGEVRYQEAGTGNLLETGVVVSRGAYHRLGLVADFNTKTYNMFVDGNFVQSAPFVDPAAQAFTDAPLVTFAVSETGFVNATGTAFFDNYRIEQIPEPATGAVLALTAVGLLARRRRQTA